MSFPFSDLGPDIVGTFASPVPVYRVRRGASTVSHGFVTEAAPVRTRITAIVQPATGKDLQVLEEGKRTEETIKVISTTDLRAAVVGQHPADRVEYAGATYEVAKLKDWNANARFYSVLATRVV